ncbi:MAG: transcription antitermination factor NusB [Desulfovibrio sp.]|jgi:N utilization substance protein B|nr:transcription antitermination factor NusB [Desulfovibrio sp.]
MTQIKKIPRRLERIFAFKVLYGLCFCPADSEEDLLRACSLAPEQPKGMETGFADSHAWRLIRGVWANRDDLDRRIGGLSQNWRPERMGRVELTLLRLALYELLFYRDTPPRVVINEAVEISRQFGDEIARGFVNGIIDAAARNMDEAYSPDRPGLAAAPGKI